MNASLDALVTPKLILIAELAQQAESGIDVTLQLRNLVAEAVEDLSYIYNSHLLVAALIQSLEAHATEAQPERNAYAMVLLRAAAMARRLQDGNT